MRNNNGGKLTSIDRDTVTIADENDEEHVDLSNIPLAEDLDGNEQEVEAVDQLLEARDDDNKKILGLKTTYEGFSIWGWVLCLFVERKGGPSKKSPELEGNAQALMQDWIASTQEQKLDDL